VGHFDLVIFDCDGVLVDSERLAVRIEAEVLATLGWPLTEAEIVDRFVGRSAGYMQSQIESTIGRPVDWSSEFEARYQETFAKELLPVAGINEALDGVDLPVCVASSGSHQKMAFTLGLTGLLDRFDGHLFSSDDVEHGKPAPDLFLYAAAHMGAEAGRCAVVEDSVSGVTAGQAAGMTIFGFAGGVTSAQKLDSEGAVVFDDMRALPDLITRWLPPGGTAG
jgi:HAD superfamily hydrolase (TIGR01509 family)